MMQLFITAVRLKFTHRAGFVGYFERCVQRTNLVPSDVGINVSQSECLHKMHPSWSVHF